GHEHCGRSRVVQELSRLKSERVMTGAEQVEKTAPALTEERVRAYLESRLGGPIRVVGLSLLGGHDTADVKEFGYGTPVKIDYERFGKRRAAVLETVTRGRFGHEPMADRAQIVLWSHDAFNRLPRHVRSLDVGGFRSNGRLVSVGDVEEFFILNEYVPGNGY